MLRTGRSRVALVGALLAAMPAFAQDWNRFRGPNGSGVSDASTAPIVWTDADYDWIVKLPGAGHSSPIVQGENVYVTAAEVERGQRSVVNVDPQAGRIRWTRSSEFAKHKKHRGNSFASSTPAADAARVYVLWQGSKDAAGGLGRSTLEAYSHAGDPAWSFDVGEFHAGPGGATSPIVVNERVIVANDIDRGSFLLAIDAATGKEVWRVPRSSTRAMYSTPCVLRVDRPTPELIFTDMHHGITGVELVTGRVTWEIDVFGDHAQRAIGSPVVSGDLVVGLSGFTTGEKSLVVVRPTRSDSGTSVEELVRLKKTIPHVPTPLVHGGLMFLVTDRGGILSCVRLRTGEVVHRMRVGGNYFASPVAAGGRLYLVDGGGKVSVVSADEKLEVLGISRLPGPSRATPAVSRGVIYFRTDTQLLSLGRRATKE